MTILLTGAAGQLAYALNERMQAAHDVVALTRRELDITDDVSVGETIRRVQPHVIINGAAYNDVDGAEHDPVAAMAINAFGVRALGRAAAAVDVTLVHFSTDFVFDGTADQPYTEECRPNPQSVYAMSKLLGEWFAATPKHYVLRVESLFGGAMQVHEDGRPRGSSLDRMADAMLAGREVRAFEDRTVTPSYVDDVAEATAAAISVRGSLRPVSLRRFGDGYLVRRCLRAERATGPVKSGRPGDDEQYRDEGDPSAVLCAVEREACARRHRHAELAGCSDEICARPTRVREQRWPSCSMIHSACQREIERWCRFVAWLLRRL